MTVHNLKSSSDGGILDPDDELSDVADDREQVRVPRCVMSALNNIQTHCHNSDPTYQAHGTVNLLGVFFNYPW